MTQSKHSDENPFAPLHPNDSPLHPILGRDDQGQVIFSLLSKYTYPLIASKTPEALSGIAVQLLPSDFCAWKPGSQLIISGSAYTVPRQPLREMLVGIYSPSLRHEILVIGCRQTIHHNHTLHFSDPRPFQRMPLGLGMAFGGQSQGFGYPPNPVGLGFHLQGPPRTLGHQALPCLEHPEQRMTVEHIGLDRKDWEMLPRPMHCGFLPSQFYPRSQKCFFSAHPSLTTTHPFAEGECIELRNIHPQHRSLLVNLPCNSPGVWLRLDNHTLGQRMHMQDVQIDPMDNRMSVLWIASFPIENEAIVLNAQELQFGQLGPGDS